MDQEDVVRLLEQGYMIVADTLNNLGEEAYLPVRHQERLLNWCRDYEKLETNQLIEGVLKNEKNRHLCL